VEYLVTRIDGKGKIHVNVFTIDERGWTFTRVLSRACQNIGWNRNSDLGLRIESMDDDVLTERYKTGRAFHCKS